jgi:hypothetical protein
LGYRQRGAEKPENDDRARRAETRALFRPYPRARGGFNFIDVRHSARV